MARREIVSADDIHDDERNRTEMEDRSATLVPAAADDRTAGEDETFGQSFNIDAGKRKDRMGIQIEGCPRPGRRSKQQGIDPDRVAMRKAPDPIKPSRWEVEERMICHIPYASWCKCCVAARALDDGHRAHKEEVVR